MRRGSISSELLMCGGGVHSILLWPLVDERIVLSRQKLYVGIVVCISWMQSCLCVDVMVMASV